MKLDVKKIGNSTGLILPKELLSRLRLKAGDELYVIEDADGGLHLTPYDPGFAEAMQHVDDIIGEYKDALREFSK